jgi:hypothetical protein
MRSAEQFKEAILDVLEEGRWTVPTLLETYSDWLETHESGVFARVAEQGRAHWEMIAEQMLAIHRRRGADAPEAIRDLVESRRL